MALVLLPLGLPVHLSSLKDWPAQHGLGKVASIPRAQGWGGEPGAPANLSKNDTRHFPAAWAGSGVQIQQGKGATSAGRPRLQLRRCS